MEGRCRTPLDSRQLHVCVRVECTCETFTPVEVSIGGAAELGYEPRLKELFRRNTLAKVW